VPFKRAKMTILSSFWQLTHDKKKNLKKVKKKCDQTSKIACSPLCKQKLPIYNQTFFAHRNL